MVTEGDEMTNEEIIAEYEADRSNPENHDTKEQDLIKALDKARAEQKELDKEVAFKTVMDMKIIHVEAGRQSAQKEIDDLNILILNERAEHQAQVRKLKHEICLIGFKNDDQFLKMLEKINEIFLDCAEEREAECEYK